jgi:hypothetical protein
MGTPPAWRARVRGGAGDPANLSEDSYRLSVLLLTFVCYALFHCNRKACALPIPYTPYSHGSTTPMGR